MMHDSAWKRDPKNITADSTIGNVFLKLSDTVGLPPGGVFDIALVSDFLEISIGDPSLNL